MSYQSSASAEVTPVRISQPHISDADIDAVVTVMRSGALTQGPEVAAFESDFGAWVGGRECVAVNSGTSALHVALLALGIGPGDEVIVPSFSFAATANAVRLAGAEPVFADVDRMTYSLDPAHAASLVTPRTAAIIPVHLYGHMADVSAFRRLAIRHGLALVEDAAQAHAAVRDNEPAGAAGDVGCFSFYPSKSMTSAEGGMVVANDPQIAEVARQLRNQGMDRPYHHPRVGGNWRMTDMAAALGRSQLRRLGQLTSRRIAHAEEYGRRLPQSATPAVAPGTRHVYHQYTLRLNDRARVASHLASRGVETRIYYPTPIHQLSSYVDDHGQSDLPVTNELSRCVLSVPVHPGLRSADLDRVTDALLECMPEDPSACT